MSRSVQHVSLHKATRVLDTSTWPYSNGGTTLVYDYQWQSADTIIFSMRDAEMPDMAVPPMFAIKVFAPAAKPVLVTNDLPKWLLSPDGHWRVGVSTKNSWTWVGVATQSHQRVTWRIPDQIADFYLPHMCWMSDSRGWVFLDGATVHVFNLDAPNREQNVMVPLLFADTEKPVNLLGMTPSSRILAASWENGQPDEIPFYEFGIDKPAATPRAYTIHKPQDAQIEDITLSPNGDILAWNLNFWHRSHSTVPTLLTSIFPFLRKPVTMQHTTELWLSNIDGTDMHPIYIQPFDEQDNSEKSYLNSVKWMPGGSRLSFIYRDALYTVPVK